jgi:hypothetical protein
MHVVPPPFLLLLDLELQLEEDYLVTDQVTDQLADQDLGQLDFVVVVRRLLQPGGGLVPQIDPQQCPKVRPVQPVQAVQAVQVVPPLVKDVVVVVRRRYYDHLRQCRCFWRDLHVSLGEVKAYANNYTFSPGMDLKAEDITKS